MSISVAVSTDTDVAQSPITNAEMIDQAKSALNCSQRELARILMHSKDQLYRYKVNQSKMPEDVRARLETIISQSQTGNGVNTLLLSLQNRAPDTDVTPMQALFDEKAATHPVFEEIMPFGFDVRELTVVLRDFGFTVPDEALPTSRPGLHQVKNIFSAFLNSVEIIHQWIEAFLVDKSQSSALERGAVREAKGRIQDSLIACSIAKMDIDSVNLHFLDRNLFGQKKKETLFAMNRDIKAFLDVYLAEGFDLIRNPFRITEADNDSLFFEMDTAESTFTSDITQYFSLAERTILREVRALRKIVDEKGRP